MVLLLGMKDVCACGGVYGFDGSNGRLFVYDDTYDIRVYVQSPWTWIPWREIHARRSRETRRAWKISTAGGRRVCRTVECGRKMGRTAPTSKRMFVSLVHSLYYMKHAFFFLLVVVVVVGGGVVDVLVNSFS